MDRTDIKYVPVAANGQVGIPETCWFGIICLTGGSIALYDGTSASGTLLYPSTALTAGQIITLQGLGLRAMNGLYAAISAGTYNVLVNAR